MSEESIKPSPHLFEAGFVAFLAEDFKLPQFFRIYRKMTASFALKRVMPTL